MSDVVWFTCMSCGAIAMQILFYYNFNFSNFQFSIFNLFLSLLFFGNRQSNI